VVLRVQGDGVCNANLVGETRGYELYFLKKKGETAQDKSTYKYTLFTESRRCLIAELATEEI
jgi:hypothetical protein